MDISTPYPKAGASPSGLVAGPAERQPVVRGRATPPLANGTTWSASRGTVKDAAVAVSLKHHLSESLVLTAVAPAGDVAGAAAGAARDEGAAGQTARCHVTASHRCPGSAGVGLSAFPDAGRAPNGRCPSLVVNVYRSSFSSFARFLETQRAPPLAGAALDGALVSGNFRTEVLM